MPRPDEADFLRHALKAHEPAVQYCQTLFQISQTLDDLVDGDKPVSQSTIVSAFWKALIELPANPFYRQNELYLRPLMAGALQDWRDSVMLERSDSEHLKTLAFVLRDQLTGVVIQCAYLVGGEQWMTKIGPQARVYFQDELLADYLNELSGITDDGSADLWAAEAAAATTK
jgi:hypothetical protein